jgi:hypothetical protein
VPPLIATPVTTMSAQLGGRVGDRLSGKLPPGGERRDELEDPLDARRSSEEPGEDGQVRVGHGVST